MPYASTPLTPALRPLGLTLAALFLAAAAPSSHASELTALWGGSEGYHNSTLAWQSDPLWSHAYTASRLDLALEASAGEATGPHGAPYGNLTHVGLTPFLNWWFLPQDALEAGIGPNLFSGTYIGGKRISTAYQFGDSLGLLHRFDAVPLTLGARFTHYSNGAIKHPNPGQNYFQLRVSYDFK
jgi:lipid A 3-O-deacylase